MSGYFSRLMKQAGIAVGPPIDPGSRVPVQRPKGLGEGGATTPTHVDREELVKPQGDDPTKETQEGSEADSGPIVEEQNPTEPVLRREASEVPRHHSEGQYHQQSRLSERRELDARDSERTLPWRGEEIGESSEEAVEGATLRADERSLPGAGSSGEEPQDRTSRERVWRDTLGEVRGWVAGSPMADDEEAENRDVSGARGATGMTTDSPFVEGRGAASHPKPTAPSSPREEPEAQDLRLEIGTISVTVEAPQKEVPKSNRRTKTAEKKSGGNSERSRLSRRYVRVR